MGKISSTEAAQRLGVSRRTVLNWLRDGRLDADKLPGRLGSYVIDADAVEQLRATIAAGNTRAAS